MRHAEKYTIDNISQTVVSPNDGSCSGTTKEDIPVPTRWDRNDFNEWHDENLPDVAPPPTSSITTGDDSNIVIYIQKQLLWWSRTL